MSEIANKKVKLGYVYLIEGIIAGMWGIYLFKFYSFYQTSYFYIDKRLSLFIQMLSFLNNNWNEVFIYFILSFLLITYTLFFNCLLYFVNKKEQQKHKILLLFLYLNLLCCLSLLINLCGFIFATILILAASLVYIIFILSKLSSTKEKFDYEEGEIIEIKGPFETKAEAQIEINTFFSKWKEARYTLDDEIYLDEDNKYYVEIYVETINSI
ncbi:hypothetical protein [Candidatus Enterococcus ikei]|uniref:Uncharacterized protein n=1 Tax=Candidatus Enterococcus ikei TaxID=2815326 RepID=A0ABS3GUW0_9ENTE|nr:hypothetical protein [Enterococcus sp. DIV0869a]MBO0439047.1 hypothetical protein [Enterococcus sp. DIV0869a]